MLIFRSHVESINVPRDVWSKWVGSNGRVLQRGVRFGMQLDPTWNNVDTSNCFVMIRQFPKNIQICADPVLAQSGDAEDALLDVPTGEYLQRPLQTPLCNFILLIPSITRVKIHCEQNGPHLLEIPGSQFFAPSKVKMTS